MSGHRDQAEEALLMRLAARYIAREANRDSLITPTRATLAPGRTKATVYVSVFPDTAVESALSFLRRRQHDFFEFLKKESRLSPIPGVRFEFDLGEKNRQHLDDISRKL
ncbi:MAG: hypothetical protein B7X04_02920 [Parcubacteria group bacterium 21-54-25]|nr:MAG: hypothetical protein B7X04_02920 [Parcubacteria group bacterium 21-54-25]HQU07913.1 hypothetical protein [Candidatus Paceibacterota bacterium]